MESKDKTPKWLKRLQKESWNLELLISGFSIFLLFQGRDMIEGLIGQVSVHHISGSAGPFLIIFLGIGYLAANVLIFNLILHILLRGFWIGAIGLSSVQNKQDFSTLNYTQKFTTRLTQKVPSLERLIIRLDNFCSTIFAFTFLIVLMLLSFFLVIIVLAIFSNIIIYVFESRGFSEDNIIINIIGVTIVIMFGIGGLLYFLDTLTLGGLKKIKWLQKIYYPIYRFFNFITFSSVYNALYYHLLTRFPKRYLIIAIIFYVGMFFISPFFTYNMYRFYPDNKTDSELLTSTYDDQRSPEERIGNASISSLIIKDQFLPVFIRYDNSQNELLLKNCTDYEPSKKNDFISGIRFTEKGVKITPPSITEAEPEKLLACLSQHYHLYLNDSLFVQTDFYFFEQNNDIGEKGLKTVLDIAHLPRGKNLLKITRMALDTAKISVEKPYATIPFWKE